MEKITTFKELKIAILLGRVLFFLLISFSCSHLYGQGVIPNFVNVDQYPSTVNSVTVTMPAGSNIGDVVMIFIATDDDGAITEPAAFTNLFEFWAGSAGPTLGVYYRVLDGTESTSYNFTFPSEPAVVTTLRFANLDTTNPIHAIANNSGTSNNPIAPSITTTIPNLNYFQYVVMDGASAGVLSSNSSTSTIIATEQSGNSAGTEMMLVSESQAGAGSSPTGSFSFASEQWATATFALTPISYSNNILCNNNGTIFDPNDDFITFDHVALNGSGTYTITSTAGTVTPSTGAYGTTTSFNLPNGSAGNGDITLTITKNSNGTQITELMTDTGNCGAGDCGGTEWNLAAIKSTIVASVTVSNSPSGTDPNNVLDSNSGTYHQYKNNVIANLNIMKFDFPEPTKLFGFEFETVHAIFDNNSNMVVQASTDDATWVNLTPTINYSADLSLVASQYGASGTVYRFAFAGNDTEYSHYRLRGISGGTQFSHRVTEVYFSYDVFDANLASVGCNDNGTPTNFTDDRVTFELNPAPGAGTYNVTVSGGFTISPTSASFGSATLFTVSAGSSGAGDLMVAVSDASVPCVQNIVIPNSENTCLDTDLDGVQDITDLDDDNDGILDTDEESVCTAVDYNILVNKQTITISKTAGTGGSQSGNPGILIDGSNTGNNFWYLDANITNLELVRLQFPTPTILSGLEYYIGNSYMLNTNCQTKIQASNDGSNWVDVSPTYTKVRPPNNAPGVLSSAPFAETFLWTNTTPYTYYRHIGVSGNANQNPYVYEIYFRTESLPLCDTDEDGIINRLDLDSDNDGIPDNIEGQPTLTYIPPAADNAATYLANLGVNSAYLGGLSRPDTDNNNIPDFADTDSEGDGILDKDESGLSLLNVVGSNGLDNGVETADTYADVNGNIDDPDTDLTSDGVGFEAEYRKQNINVTVTANQAACANPSDSPLSTIIVTGANGAITKAGFSMGTIYFGPDFASASTVSNLTTGYTVVSGLANPEFTTFYTVRAYLDAVSFEDYVVSIDKKVCSTADLSLSISPLTTDGNEGEQLLYTITLTNAGPDPAVNVEVKVDIPIALNVLLSTASLGAYNTTTQMWSLDLVPVGSQTLDITYQVQ